MDESFNILDQASEIARERDLSFGSLELTKEEEEILAKIFDSKANRADIRLVNIHLMKLLGAHEAIFLHSLRGFLKYNKNVRVMESRKGKWKAVYNTYDQWMEILPMQSRRSFERMVSKLERLEIIFSKRTPRGKYYGINFKALVYYINNPKELLG